MTGKSTSLRTRFKTESDAVISLDKLAEMVGLPTAFQKLVTFEGRVAADIASISAVETDFPLQQRETLRFVPQMYNGKPHPYADFWLQIHMEGVEENPVMSLRFMETDKNGQLSMTVPCMVKILNKDDIYYRPTLGHPAIDNIADLIYQVVGKPLKEEPVRPPVPKPGR